MINNLVINNGNIDHEFDPYIYEYTVSVSNSVDHLEFEYELNDDAFINIINNNLDEEENIVYLNVYTVDEESTYTFIVYKEIANYSSGIDIYKNNLEITSQDNVDLYKVQILCSFIFLIIVIIFSIIFRKRND